MSVSLLVIDPQNDFCSPDGALYVPGAEEDCARLSSFVEKNISKIDSVFVTLDCHPYFHIAHPNFWVNQEGKEPAPFTVITHKDFENGVYNPAVLGLRPMVDSYLMSLESQGRYELTIWPPHCIQGTNGICVYPELWKSLNNWEKARHGNSMSYVVKSSSPLTEHYSAIRAEVQDDSDVTTKTNYSLIEKLKRSDMIFVAGEALSHCVANTLRDLCIYIQPKKISLIQDCTSSVKLYERIGEEFLEEYKSKGMNIVKSTDLI